jgi:hypothetical protein
MPDETPPEPTPTPADKLVQIMETLSRSLFVLRQLVEWNESTESLVDIRREAREVLGDAQKIF